MPEVLILGFAVHPPAECIREKRLEELVFDTSAGALKHAGVERSEIDHITLAASDELDGRSITSMLLAAPAGGYLKDETRCTDSGLVGLCLASTRIASGRFHLGLLASWSKPSIAPFEDVMRMGCEPFFTRPVGLNASIANGLFAQALMSCGIVSDAKADEKAVNLSIAAARNTNGICRPALSHEDVSKSAFVATPLRLGHQAPLTDGAVSLVLCSDEWLSRNPRARPVARVAGLGWSVDSYALGGERLTALASFRNAFGAATRQAGVGEASDLDAIELDSQTAFHALAYEAALDLIDSPSINRSGSAFAQNPYFCAGLVNAVEAVRQVSGTAGNLQVKNARRAAGHGQHGLAQQGNAVVVVEQV